MLMERRPRVDQIEGSSKERVDAASFPTGGSEGKMKMASTQLSAWCSMASERRSSAAYGWECGRRVDLRQGGGGGGPCEAKGEGRGCEYNGCGCGCCRWRRESGRSVCVQEDEEVFVYSLWAFDIMASPWLAVPMTSGSEGTGERYKQAVLARPDLRGEGWRRRVGRVRCFSRLRLWFC